MSEVLTKKNNQNAKNVWNSHPRHRSRQPAATTIRQAGFMLNLPNCELFTTFAVFYLRCAIEMAHEPKIGKSVSKS